MINAEFYKEKLLKLAKKDIRCGLNSKGDLVDCDGVSCTGCQWNTESTDCECEMIKWLLAERKEYPKLTRYEFEVLNKALCKGYYFITRNKNKCVNVNRHKPNKMVIHWDNCIEPMWYMEILVNESDFEFVKWTDEEPWNIQELLENCEVEE